MVSQITAKVESANEIFVRQARKVLVPPISTSASAAEPADKIYLASLIKNLESVGYGVSKDLLNACEQLPLAELAAINSDVLSALKHMVGAHETFNPMYPNFPQQVMKASEVGLYLNALVHYLTDGKFIPRSVKEPRPALDEGKLKILHLGTIDEFKALFTRMASSNTSIAQHDQDDLAWFINHYGDDIIPLLPPTFPHREVKAIVGARLIESTVEARKIVPDLCNTATDVLRLAVALSGGDVSLAVATKFRQFKRPERRLLLECLEKQENCKEDMWRWADRWIRLGERLHPGEHRKRFPQQAEAFDVIRNHGAVQTFNNRLELAIKNRQVKDAVTMLKTRPGFFARRLDHLLRLSEGSAELQNFVIEQFDAVCNTVSTPVLLQVRQHFATRNVPTDMRIFLPKGNVAKAQGIKNNLPPLSPDLTGAVVDHCTGALKDRFAKLPPMGKCYIDPELQNFPVPFSQRSASKSLRTASRGSRLSLPEANTLRFFIWWKNGKARTDLDLSAVLFDKDFVYISDIAYYNLKDFSGHHSGDIVDAPKGASEFIDLSRERCLEKNVRYIVMVVTSFTLQPYCDLPECFAGWMGREKANSGEIYEPKTVEDKLDLSANSKIAVPAVFDIVEKRVIWTDLSLTNWPYWCNNVDINLRGIQLTLKSIVELRKTSIYDLLTLHAQARGQVVEKEADADRVFSVAAGTPFDLSSMASDFMQSATTS